MELGSAVLSSLFVFLITAALLYHRVTKRIPKKLLPEESRRKAPVFRVRGLPAPQRDDELDDELDDKLNAKLKATIEDNLSEEEKSRLTFSVAIVPSCYNNEHKRDALVEFYGRVPQFLSALEKNPLGDWQVEMGDTDINFDCHFWGFTQLYTPKLDAPVTAE
jgi:hypothetical protein